MVLTNNNLNNSSQRTDITTTTTTTQAPVMQQSLPQQNVNILKKEAIVTNVQEKPVLQNVIEKKNVEVHHRPVVQEIHEQKIIEIQRQPVLQNVQQGTIVQQSKAETRFEEIGSANIGEQERLRLEQLRLTSAPQITQQQGGIQQFREGEVITQVSKQEFIERHVQPVITEVREQNVVQEVIHPVVRKVHEGTIIREVQTAPIQNVQMTQGTQFLQQGAQTSSTLTQTTGTTSSVNRELLQQQQMDRTRQTTGFQQPLNQGFQQPMTQQTQLGGSNLGSHQVQTTTTSSGLNTTTSTSGAPIQAELSNLNQHEGKILNKEGRFTNAEQSNLAQHERVVEQFAEGRLAPNTTIGGNQMLNKAPGSNLNSGLTTQTTQPLGTTHGTTTTDPNHKPGLMGKLKGALHMNK